MNDDNIEVIAVLTIVVVVAVVVLILGVSFIGAYVNVSGATCEQACRPNPVLVCKPREVQCQPRTP